MPQNKPIEKETDRLLRLHEVLAKFPVSRSSWYRGIQAGIYPKPLKIGSRMSAWRESEILQLINDGVSDG